MILQALTKLYEDLAKQGRVPRLGWSKTKISYALRIDEDGELIQIVPMFEEVTKNNKVILTPHAFELPAPVKRTAGISSNFLWDNSSYMLGIDGKNNPQRSVDCFNACKKLHELILGDVTNSAAKSILRFFDKWIPENSKDHEILSQYYDSIIDGANLIFQTDDEFPHEIREIEEAWQKHYDKGEGQEMQCLVTGERDFIANLHPLIKGVDGAQATGANLVSFNAPIGKKTAFAYTTALNHLLADRNNVQRIGDTTVVCWADGAEPEYSQISSAAMSGVNSSSEMSEDDLRTIVKRLADGLPCKENNLDPKKEFYILGLAPNAARLSVRFFLNTTFGELMRNVNAHHERMEIVGSRYSMIPLWALLRETVNQNSKDKSPSPTVAGATARAIFQDILYPASLLEATILRIRAERDITYGKAAIIKAYYLKNTDIRCPKEVLTVSLNENSTNIPYTIGRLFAVYEAVQEAANPGINATIKDKYFNSVAATPANILPILDKLCHHHLRKLNMGKRIYFDKQISALKSVLGEENPARFGLPEQGSFYLGYYHQKEKRFEKKENN